METLIDRITRHEGVRLKPYRDSLGKLSIGVGRCLDTNGISHDEAVVLLDNDIAKVTDQVQRAFPWTDFIDDTRRDVLIEMAFQLGIHGLMGFPKMLAALQAEDYDEAAKEMLDSAWHKQTPARCEELAGLMLKGS